MTDQLTCTITRDCQIACLASLLTRPTFDALMAGMVSQDDSPATVGQLVELYQYDKLTDIFNIGSSRSGEIRWALVQAGLIEPTRVPLVRQWIRNDGHDLACPGHQT
jgi:hypothetical protein